MRSASGPFLARSAADRGDAPSSEIAMLVRNSHCTEPLMYSDNAFPMSLTPSMKIGSPSCMMAIRPGLFPTIQTISSVSGIVS